MRTISSKSKKINQYIAQNPQAKPAEIAKMFKISVQSVYQRKNNLKKVLTKLGKASYQDAVRSRIASVPSVKDLINNPAHYTVGGVETIDFIEAKKLDYNLGNVVKYVSRAEYKDSKIANLKKAQWYLNRAVAKLEGASK